MTNHIELEIRNLLKSQYSAREVATRLLDRIFDPQIGFDAKRAIFSFAFNAGLLKEAYRLFPHLLRDREKIPWAHFMAMTQRAGVIPTKEALESVIKGARRQELVSELVLFKQWDKYDARFAELRGQIETQRLDQERRQRELLFDKLGFFRNQRLIEEEQRILNLLLKMYPDDLEIKNARADFDDRWARHVITRHTSVEMDLEKTHNSKDDSDQEWAWLLTQNMQKIIEDSPRAAYDFAIAMWFMEFYDCSLHLLQLAAPGTAVDWFKAELLLRCRRFIDALDWLMQLEKKYGADPESVFAVTYLRAQALWGLGQTTSAMELMQSLVQVRPNYRSASSLLTEWRGGQRE